MRKGLKASALFLVFMVVALGALRAHATKETVPIDGSLSVSNAAPQPGDIITLYFNVTPRGAGYTKTSFKIPEGVEVLEGEVAEREFEYLKAGETVTHILKVRVKTDKYIQIFSSASQTKGEPFTMSRSFMTELNARHKEPQVCPECGCSASGQPLTIYESGTGK